MLSEEKKNVVCFSNLLRIHYPKLYKELASILKKEMVECHTIKHTADYWCRDYMPVQRHDGAFVQFVYNPDYLQDDKAYITNVDKVIDKMSFGHPTIHKCELNLDGGGLVFCRGIDSNYIIITEKIAVDNPIPIHYIEQQLKEIFALPNLQVVWLPWDEEERFGHTDGMVRYIGQTDEGKPIVLVNLSVYELEYADKVKVILSKYFKVVELKFSQYDDMSWAYINSIQTDRIIIVPGIGNSVTDTEALEQRNDLYPQYEGRIYQVQMHDFIEEGGGALNCCSWTYLNLKKKGIMLWRN